MLVKLLVVLFLNSSLSYAAIYGADDRKDIYEVPHYRSIARAVAVAVGKHLLIENADGTSRVDLADDLAGYMCSDEPFIHQPSLGVCTGFLVSDRYLLTAGHCALPVGVIDDEFHPFCENFNWYFDYNISDDNAATHLKIPKDKLYGCKRIIRAENIMGLPANLQALGNDFALIELDRRVSDEIEPLRISLMEVKRGQTVFTIGHPIGLPAKFSGFSRVADASAKPYFVSYLDTQGGNSGGPVFNLHDEVVGILVSGHPIDFFEDPVYKCERFNKCDDGGKKCSRNSTFTDLPTSNFIQRLEPILPYMRSSTQN